MAYGNWNLQFLNQNSQRRFPLADDNTNVDESGSFTIPDDFIVALDFPINAANDVDSGGFFLQSLVSSPNGYSIMIGYQPAIGDPISVAVASIPSSFHQRNTVYNLGGINGFADSSGKIAIGRLDNIDSQPPGAWTFSLDTARICPTVIRPILRTVTSITCVNGNQTSIALQGNVELQAGANMTIVPIVTPGADPIIVISAISGEGTIEDCVCTDDTTPPSPILTINGNPASNLNDFSIIGDNCIQITPIQNGIQISNTCAQPCCGPVELERITQDLERMGQEEATLSLFVQQLQTAVDTMSMVVLASKLNDMGCS